ncbi:MAG: hypothetical protein ACTHOH_04160 [Lysobacteraceae bacterium]
MTLNHQQYADLSDNAYVNRRSGVRSPEHREFETLHGVRYEILEHYRNSANGYAGTVYQRVDTGDIVVAHRGTEVKNIPGVVMDLAYTDGSMVLGRVNPQAQDAIRLTQHALQFAEEKGLRNGGHTPEVTSPATPSAAASRRSPRIISTCAAKPSTPTARRASACGSPRAATGC